MSLVSMFDFERGLQCGTPIGRIKIGVGYLYKVAAKKAPTSMVTRTRRVCEGYKLGEGTCGAGKQGDMTKVLHKMLCRNSALRLTGSLGLRPRGSML